MSFSISVSEAELRFRLYLLLVLLAASLSYGQTTYYVSSSEGDDSKDGKSQSKAWASIDRVTSHAGWGSGFFVSGDSILFKRGDVFRGQYNWTFHGNTGAPIVIGAYGTGDKPCFDGDWVDGGFFSPINGRPGYFRGPKVNGGTVTVWEFYNGSWQWLKHKAEPANHSNREAWLDTLYAGQDGGPSDTMYIHPYYGNIDSVMVVPPENDIGGENFIFRDIRFQNQYQGMVITQANGIPPTQTRDVKLINVSARYIPNIAIKVTTGCTRVEIDSCTVDTVSYTPIYFYLTYNCVAHANRVNFVQGTLYWGTHPEIPTPMIFSYEQAGLGDQGDDPYSPTDSTSFGNKWEYNEVTDIANSGFDSFYNIGDTVQYNIFTGTKQRAITLLGRNNVIRGNEFHDIDEGMNLHQNGGGNNTVIDNTFYNLTGYGIAVQDLYQVDSSRAIISGNTFHAATGFSPMFTGFNSRSFATSTNNEFHGSGRWATAVGSNITYYYTLKGFQDSTRYEAGSMWYVAPTGTFSVTPDSLALNGGTVQLVWTSANATFASISPGIGIVPLSGDTTISVATTTNFKLTLVGVGDTAVYTARVFVAQPPRYFLNQNYPNPFRTGTTIEFGLPAAGYVTIKVYDILGREVATVVDGMQTGGEHSVQWMPKAVASGVYRYRITCGSYSKTGRMVLVH